MDSWSIGESLDFEGRLCFAEATNFLYFIGNVEDQSKQDTYWASQTFKTLDTFVRQKNQHICQTQECSPRDAVNTLGGIVGRGEGGTAEEKSKVSPKRQKFVKR